MTMTIQSYKTMKVKELKDLCKQKKIKVPSKSKKADIIQLLETDDQTKIAKVKKAIPQTKQVVKKTVKVSKSAKPVKLARNAFPMGHTPDDFECFGPAATKDGEFSGTRIADLGCFTQDGKDSNKYYHGAVVKSKIDKQWYAYFEYGRTGATSPAFNLIACPDRDSAEKEYSKQLHKKNDKRGEWHDHPTLGRILRAKKGKDCYLVRPQATRVTGLPGAKILVDSTIKTTAKPAKKKGKKKGVVADVHPEIIRLMNDLNVGTVTYTKKSMAEGAALPTQSAIDEARDICTAALERLAKLNTNDVDDQVNDQELKDLTYHLYGRIPKKKALRAAATDWILSQNNIVMWKDDLDAYESALYSTENAVEITEDPYGGMPLTLEYLPRDHFIYDWTRKATRNRHGYLGDMKIKHVWAVNRHGDDLKLKPKQDEVSRLKIRNYEVPLHQLKDRKDISRDEKKLFLKSNTCLLFHGTRSVNVSGILRTDLRLPKQLVGVHITGAMFGPGAYFADDWKKSAGYTSLKRSYWSQGSGSISGREAFMFVTDVVLGKPHVASGCHGYTSAPSGCHSVMGKMGRSGVQNNEYIVYNTQQHRLRYLVEFDA